MMMRPLCWPGFAVAVFFVAPPSIAGPYNSDPSARRVIAVSDEIERQEPGIDMFASMTGKCSKLTIAGRDFRCTSVAFFHDQQGRSSFTIALNDPTDASHVVAFSGESAQREQEDLYELHIDRMMLNSKDRPKVDGLPVPAIELSTGLCKQLGNFATRQVSSVSCTATDKSGKKYELQFESDGSPIKLQKIRQSDLTAEERRARQLAAQLERLKCRQKADVARVLPRDRTAYIIRCLSE
jgi:hypothetical protein